MMPWSAALLVWDYSNDHDVTATFVALEQSFINYRQLTQTKLWGPSTLGTSCVYRGLQVANEAQLDWSIMDP